MTNDLRIVPCVATDEMKSAMANQSERIATLEAALREAAGYVDIMNTDEGDRFRAIAGGRDNETK